MPKYHIIKLTKLSPMHIGTGKENYDFSASELQSDTLSGALAALRAQNGNAGDLKKFMDSFILSSAFP
jgi:CRISPR/Cas system CSM-associated protein Csm4 (group 5 of RAMP superfamily)